MKPLHWPADFPLPAQSSWLQRLFNPFKSYTPMKNTLNAQLQARLRPDPCVWGDDPLRLEIALLLCKRIQETYQWRNDHFIPDDPFDIVFMIPWDDLEIVEMTMHLEEELDIKIEDEEAMAWGGTTLNNVVDTLVAKCRKPSVS